MAPLKVVHSERVNAVIGWVLTSIVALTVVESFLTNALLWGGFGLFIIVVTMVPVVSTKEWTVMIPWPLLLVAATAMLVGALGLYFEIAGYLAVASLALIVATELDAFTPVDMSRRFAIGFAVLTTMAFQGLWIIAQFVSDKLLGTEFLRSQTELQWDIVIVTVVALVMGGVFTWYFERVGHVGSYKRSMNSVRSS
ncbi:hypothetical protein [Haladaptatus halobius]|uniref:hypothetical protein n=1 Tax=Haladaptatus halobius TaxID=2884875 RepID=UPI001D09EFCF|nr:hypothetical protein [Haladaptatus halobius]